MPPLTSLDQRTLDVVASLVAEPTVSLLGSISKSSALTGLQNDLKRRVCRRAGGMANSGGGVLVFGVRNKGANVEERMTGITPQSEPRHAFAQIVKRHAG